MVFLNLQPGVQFRISPQTDNRGFHQHQQHQHHNNFSPSPQIDQYFFQPKPGTFSPNGPVPDHRPGHHHQPHHQDPHHHLQPHNFQGVRGDNNDPRVPDTSHRLKVSSITGWFIVRRKQRERGFRCCHLEQGRKASPRI